MAEAPPSRSGPDAYLMLLASLPGNERLFLARQPPISRLRLDGRLRALEPQDRVMLARIERVVRWSQARVEDGDVIAQAEAQALLDDLDRPTLQTLIAERMELRTIVAALRRRRAGLGPPAPGWGFGRWLGRIRAQWETPSFGLERAVPWLPEAARLVEGGDPLALERYLIEVTHGQLKRHKAGHLFDFEAVVIYVLIWSIYDRWAKTESVAAERRFVGLADSALEAFSLPPLDQSLSEGAHP